MIGEKMSYDLFAMFNNPIIGFGMFMVFVLCFFGIFLNILKMWLIQYKFVRQLIGAKK